MHGTTHPGVLLASRTPPLFIEGNQTHAAEVPSMQRGARQGGVCSFIANTAKYDAER